MARLVEEGAGDGMAQGQLHHGELAGAPEPVGLDPRQRGPCALQGGAGLRAIWFGDWLMVPKPSGGNGRRGEKGTPQHVIFADGSPSCADQRQLGQLCGAIEKCEDVNPDF